MNFNKSVTAKNCKNSAIFGLCDYSAIMTLSVATIFDANVADDSISYSSRVSRVNGQISEVAKLRHLQRAMDDGGADFMRIH